MTSWSSHVEAEGTPIKVICPKEGGMVTTTSPSFCKSPAAKKNRKSALAESSDNSRSSCVVSTNANRLTVLVLLFTVVLLCWSTQPNKTFLFLSSTQNSPTSSETISLTKVEEGSAGNSKLKQDGLSSPVSSPITTTQSSGEAAGAPTQTSTTPTVSSATGQSKDETEVTMASVHPVSPQPPPPPVRAAELPPEAPTTPPPPTTLYHEIVHNRCQCKEPFVEQYEAMLSAALATPPAPTALNHPLRNETDDPSVVTKPPQQRNRKGRAAAPTHPSLRFWQPESYGIKHPIRRFLRRWFWEVMQHRERAGSGDASSSTPPEARILLIGDSLNRNMFYSMIVQTIDERLLQNDFFGKYARHVVKHSSQTYQHIYVTWPNENATLNSSSIPSSTSAGRSNIATIKIRTEQQIYFGMDTHSLKSSRGLEFNPTHVFVSRGFWDLVHAEPHDPSIAIASLSAGLVRLRKELADHREELPVEERNLYPPARVVYVALPKVFKSNEPFAKLRRSPCHHDHDQMFYRDAFYAAVRRANGALLHLHGKEKFSSVAIEVFDYYAMSMAAGAGNTLKGDGRHPSPKPRVAILAQMLDLVSQPPRSQESVQQLVDDAQANNRVFLNATMYIPPPLVVGRDIAGEQDNASKTTSCPLSFVASDVVTIQSPPKVGGYGAEAAFTTEVEDLTPPPIVLGAGFEELFVANLKCKADITADWSVVAKVGVMASKVLRQQELVQSPSSSPPAPAATPSKLVPEFLTSCALLLDAWISRYQSLVPLYKSATPPLSAPNATMVEKALWYGNRCLHFINSEVAAHGGPEAYYNQLWDYTDERALICATPTYIMWFTRQPVLRALLSDVGDDGDRLARCAMKHGGVRPARKKKK